MMRSAVILVVAVPVVAVLGYVALLVRASLVRHAPKPVRIHVAEHRPGGRSPRATG